MARIGESTDLLKCSFCGKSQKQVRKLIAGPGVYICDECIELCNEIIEEELAEVADLGSFELPKPREIFDFLQEYVIGQEPAKRSRSTTTTSASRPAMPPSPEASLTAGTMTTSKSPSRTSS
jgi:hypothetical protein